MLTYADYVGKWAACPDLTGNIEVNARFKLIPAVNKLLEKIKAAGIELQVNPGTGTIVSGQQYGGFRPQECTIGAPQSNHKRGLAVDIYDPTGEIDAWCMENRPALVECGIWLEHPDATVGWCHMQAVPPKSRNRVFKP